MSKTHSIPDTHDPDSFTHSHNPEVGEMGGGSLLGHLWASIAATVLLVVICCGAYPIVVWGLAQVAFPNQANGSLVKKDGTYTTKEDEAVGSALLGQNFFAPQYFHPRPSAAGAGYDAANSSGSNLGPLSDKLLNGVTTPATTQPTAQPETLAYDGVRLRTIHYAADHGIAFKLYNVKFDEHGNLVSKTGVPISKFQDKDGNLNDVALVDAFPHTGDPADKVPLVADDFSTRIPADAVTASGSGLDPHISPTNATLQKSRVAKARGISDVDVQKLIEAHTAGPDLGILGDPAVNVLMLNLALDTKYPMPSTQPAAGK